MPDRLTRIGIEGGELLLHPGFDVVHYFPPLGSFMLKYFNEGGGGMSNVMMHEASARYIVAEAGLEIVNRGRMFDSEHDALMQWQVGNFDAEFGL